jgi:hypothetical protein
MSEDRVNDELASFEAALESLRPAPSCIDRDRLMFLAGRAAAADRMVGTAAGPTGPRFRLLWPAATAVSLLVAVALGTLLAMRGPRQPVTRAPSPRPGIHRPGNPGPDALEPSVSGADGTLWPALAATTPAELSAGRNSYLALRRAVLREGVDALPVPKSSSAAKDSLPKWGPGARGAPSELFDG